MTDSTQLPDATEIRDLYLATLEGSLTHTLYEGLDAVPYPFPRRNPLYSQPLRLLRKRGIIPVRFDQEVEEQREEGKDFPLFAQTMVGLRRLRHLRSCIETILAEAVPGDLIETGVWRGGASIYMRGVLKAYGVTDRTVWAADSFAGLPPPGPATHPDDDSAIWHTVDYLRVGLDDVKENFRRYGLLDDQVEFLQGWFRDTLPTVRDHEWALARLDGDMYESTMDGLINLYPGLAPGGFLVVDDYSIESCRRAVKEFRRDMSIDEPMERIDWTAVCWRKSS